MFFVVYGWVFFFLFKTAVFPLGVLSTRNFNVRTLKVNGNVPGDAYRGAVLTVIVFQVGPM